jgi:hypothetical protein
MTRDEILSLEPGKQTDAAVAMSMGWKIVQGRRPGLWRNGKQIRSRWKPSTDWSDTGYLIDRIIANPLRRLTQVAGYGVDNRVIFWAEIKALDHFGPGPLPVVNFWARADDPKMAVCRVFLLMQYGLYDQKESE